MYIYEGCSKCSESHPDFILVAYLSHLSRRHLYKNWEREIIFIYVYNRIAKIEMCNYDSSYWMIEFFERL